MPAELINMFQVGVRFCVLCVLVRCNSCPFSRSSSTNSDTSLAATSAAHARAGLSSRQPSSSSLPTPRSLFEVEHEMMTSFCSARFVVRTTFRLVFEHLDSNLGAKTCWKEFFTNTTHAAHTKPLTRSITSFASSHATHSQHIFTRLHFTFTRSCKKSRSVEQRLHDGLLIRAQRIETNELRRAQPRVHTLRMIVHFLLLQTHADENDTHEHTRTSRVRVNSMQSFESMARSHVAHVFPPELPLADDRDDVTRYTPR